MTSRISYRDYDSRQHYLKHQKGKLKSYPGILRQTSSQQYIDWHIEELRPIIDMAPDGKVLCMGARRGAEVVAFKKFGYEDAMGVDLNPGPQDPETFAVEECAGLVQEGDMHDLDFDDDTFAAVYCNCIDHCRDLQKVLSEVLRVLRDDGVFILRFPRSCKGGKYESCLWKSRWDIWGAVIGAGFRLDYSQKSQNSSRPRDEQVVATVRRDVSGFIADERKYGPRVAGRLDEPFISRSAVEWLRENLSDDLYRYGLEWGMGTSTPWLCQRLDHLWSVEHNFKWYCRTHDYLLEREKLFKKWQGFLIPHGPERKAAYRGKLVGGSGDFESYVKVVESLPTLHFVMIDGRARNACLRHVLRKIKSHNAILVFDNPTRGRYDLSIVPSHWERIDCFDPPLYTSIWVTCRK